VAGHSMSRRQAAAAATAGSAAGAAGAAVLYICMGEKKIIIIN